MTLPTHLNVDVEPCSYLAHTNKGTLRRDRSALVVTTKHPVTQHSTKDLPSETTTAPNPTLPSPIPPSQQSPQTPRKPTAGQAMLTTPETAPAAESPRGPCTNTSTTRSGRVVKWRCQAIQKVHELYYLVGVHH